MCLIPKPQPVLADLGGDPRGAFQFVIIGLCAVLGAEVLFFLKWFLRDLFRFGREGYPWFVAVATAVLFAGDSKTGQAER